MIMSPHRMHTALHAFIIAVGLMIGAPLTSAATWNLSNVPLAAATSVVPNVFFELDDSGSLDWEVMTPGYWTWRAYNPDETLIGNSFTSSNGGIYNEDGLWDSYYSTTSSGGGGWGGGGGGTTYTSATYDYIFNSSDNLFGTGCDKAVIACGALGTSTNYPYKLDWRILSSSFNTVYYDPSLTYSPWAGPSLATSQASCMRCGKMIKAIGQATSAHGAAAMSMSRAHRTASSICGTNILNTRSGPPPSPWW